MNNSIENVPLWFVKVESEYIHAFDFEVYDINKAVAALEDFRPYMYGTIGIYLCGIYFGTKWMKNREPFRLDTALLLWNVALAIFSIISTLRGFPEMMFLLSEPNGVHNIICTFDKLNYATAFWGLMFALSKIVELGDTAFIVLRKQKLIFLHWYHHITVLLLSWFGFEFLDTFAHLYMINTFVHSFMYSYYALRALKFKIPKMIAMSVTTLQILQMVVLCFVNVYSAYAMHKGLPCRRETSFMYGLLFVTASYFVLFINFFVRAYLMLSKPKTE